MNWITSSPLRRARGGIVFLVRHVAEVVRSRAPRPGQSGRREGPLPSSRLTRKYQALLAPLPPRAEHATHDQRWPATWHGVARAGNAAQLLTALVTAADSNRPADGSPLTVTMVVVGPGDSLDVGDDFTLWQGGDIAHGVVTRRLFV